MLLPVHVSLLGVYTRENAWTSRTNTLTGQQENTLILVLPNCTAFLYFLLLFILARTDELLRKLLTLTNKVSHALLMQMLNGVLVTPELLMTTSTNYRERHNCYQPCNTQASTTNCTLSYATTAINVHVTNRQ